jgi:hypothetical protein
MKLSLIAKPQNLTSLLRFAHAMCHKSAKGWFPIAPADLLLVQSLLFSQLVLQSAVQTLVRPVNDFDIQHFESIKKSLVKVIKVELQTSNFLGLDLAITTSKMLKGHTKIGYAEYAVIHQLVTLFDLANLKTSDKVTRDIFEWMQTAIVDVAKYINKTDVFFINDQADFFEYNANDVGLPLGSGR